MLGRHRPRVCAVPAALGSSQSLVVPHRVMVSGLKGVAYDHCVEEKTLSAFWRVDNSEVQEREEICFLAVSFPA